MMVTILHALVHSVFNHPIFQLSMAVPGPVTGLNFTKISATILQISWSEPVVTNGVILLYSIQVESVMGSIFQTSVSGDQKSLLTTNLSKYNLSSHSMYTVIPYICCCCR